MARAEQGVPPDQGASPSEVERPERTPPLRLPGQALWRGFLIISVFVLASSLLTVAVDLDSEPWSTWWIEILVVPGFVLGLVVAIVDYARRRSR